MSKNKDQKKLIDYDTGIQYCGDEELYMDLLNAYYEQRDKYRASLASSFEEKNWKDCGVYAHALKSTSLTIGAVSMSELAASMEKAAKAEDIAALEENWDNLRTLYETVISEAEIILQKYNKKKISDPADLLLETIKAIHAETDYDSKEILVVDDDNGNLVIVQALLGDFYNIKTALSGREALDYLKESIPDLILLDLQMPEMDGFEVMAELQQSDRYRKIPVIFLTADRSREAEEKCFKIGAVDFINKPVVAPVLVQRVKRIMELQDYNHRLEEMVKKQLKRITKLQTEIIVIMANMIESRDGTTGQHIQRTQAYAKFLAEKMAERGLYADILTPKFIDNLERATIMHDIGKIAIPDSVLQKPGRFTPEEYELMKTHSSEGGRMIKENMKDIGDKPFLQIAYDVATYHHEMWNGNGYPEGLAGEEIPLSARIVAVVDVFDALIAKRQYKDGMPMEKALAIMKEERGIRYEEAIFDVFIETVEEMKALLG